MGRGTFTKQNLPLAGKGLLALLILAITISVWNSKASPPDTKIVSVQPASRVAAVSTKTETITQSIAFDTKTQEDASLSKGTSLVRVPGQNGTKTLTYLVTYTEGIETNRELQKQEVTVQPTTQITAVGTYVAPPPRPAASSTCDPNYTGGCVPQVSYDLDCPDIGFSVQVVKNDPHRFDRDGDGYGCESYSR
jgi:hypothetical protein